MPPPPAPPAAFDERSVDLDAFLADIDAIRREVDASLGPEDVAHVRTMERVGHVATALGLATCWIAPNPLSAGALALGRSTQWLLMHHCGHRGYDKVPDVPARFTCRVFARGWRRFVDWADWMLPEAWIYEHNVLHHGHTGELRDPDLIERNTEWLRNSKLPLPVKYAAMGFLAVTWRSFYYAPNTLRVWLELEAKKKGLPVPAEGEGLPPGFQRTLWLRSYLPYSALNFVALPLAFLPLGPWASASALSNSLAAEALTNLHTFAVVGPNHTGEDLYRFDTKPVSRGETMLRQVLGSVNYACGSELVDYAHLYLNYQIEHHLYPDLPMARYREVQPKVKAVCEKHGIPYVQESVLERVRKMVQVAVGKATMMRSSGLRGFRDAAARDTAEAAE
jgi:fatty acid desaturase